ncbi:hypothetical protein, partial [Sphingomonas zeae]
QRLLRDRPLAHHRPVSAYLPKIESNHQRDCKRAFFNTIGTEPSFAAFVLSGGFPQQRSSRRSQAASIYTQASP